MSKSVFILSLLLVPLARAHEGIDNYGHHGMMGGFYGGYGMGFFGWIIPLLGIAVLILLIIWLIKQIQK
jgi:uncharacterized membrane protein